MYTTVYPQTREIFTRIETQLGNALKLRQPGHPLLCQALVPKDLAEERANKKLDIGGQRSRVTTDRDRRGTGRNFLIHSMQTQDLRVGQKKLTSTVLTCCTLYVHMPTPVSPQSTFQLPRVEEGAREFFPLEEYVMPMLAPYTNWGPPPHQGIPQRYGTAFFLAGRGELMKSYDP